MSSYNLTPESIYAIRCESLDNPVEWTKASPKTREAYKMFCDDMRGMAVYRLKERNIPAEALNTATIAHYKCINNHSQGVCILELEIDVPGESETLKAYGSATLEFLEGRHDFS